jgi:hypothetical protein
MSEPIKVGDLVQVVRTCCADMTKFLGHIFTAAPPKYDFSCGSGYCARCHYKSAGQFFYDGKRHFGEWRLKRIPPLSELEGEKNKEELTA